jgi:hypothetical protein
MATAAAASASQALDLIELRCRQNDDTGVAALLPVLGLGDLTTALLDMVFARFAMACVTYDAPDAMHTLVKAWDDAFYIDDMAYTDHVFCSLIVPDEAVMYMVASDPSRSLSYAAALAVLSAQPSTPATILGIQRCLRLGTLNAFRPDDLRMLRDRAAAQNQTEVADVLGDAWRTTQPSVGRPDWVHVPDPLDPDVQNAIWTSSGVPTETSLVALADAALDEETEPLDLDAAQNMTLDATVDVALDGWSGSPVERERAAIALRATLQLLTPAERYRSIVAPALKNVATYTLGASVRLSKTFGPVNPLVGATLTTSAYGDVCCDYGGCRMLLCTCFEADDDEPTLRADTWFREKCDACDRTIAAPWYAVRRPLMGGGWSGCYCSLACMRPRADTLLETLLIKSLETQLNETGIYDRIANAV